MPNVVATKDLLRKYLPPSGVRILKSIFVSVELLSAYIYDFLRYRRYSSSIDPTSDLRNMRAMITERYHSIEKGMSLPEPRPAFGARPINDVLRYSDTYVSRFGRDELMETVAAVLAAYLEFNKELQIPDEDIPHFGRIKSFLSVVSPAVVPAGTHTVTRRDVLEATESVKLDFFTTRRTVRQFAKDPVSIGEVEFAARAARQSPAVCNRQFGRLYVYRTPDAIERVLEVQGGANGFASEVTGLAIVTTNLRSYWNDSQRNQAWIDGGLFAMNFILGLHAQGIGSVCLNWSKSPSIDQTMRALTGIPQDEAIIMLVGFGRLRSEYKVASSPRQSIDSLLLVDQALTES